MNKEDYDAISKYVFDVCGIVLGDGKEYLVEHRLKPILNELDCHSFPDLTRKLNSGTASFSIREKIINAMTTNETSFFRDEQPYDTFRDIIMPDMFKRVKQRKERTNQRRGAKVRMWSVAASTGQEPYSMAMIIADAVSAKGMGLVEMEDFGILGTDISSRVLAKAIRGMYGAFEVARGLTQEMLARHFIEEGDFYVIRENLRRMVEFKAFNILEPFTQIGSFDVIFCRNILIYFTNEAKREILAQLYEVLAPNGYLLLGSTENMYDLNSDFTMEWLGETTVYRKPA
ncbi:MAG: protein-glutamate O-methyltransferase CheR [Candidatus Fibromonas sp.]|jgi:chemotaxis protein methyltransferase CheR|nr:protein-glutamate O-methyltransferase CheR [Candidatus Fibromonas sp.]